MQKRNTPHLPNPPRFFYITRSARGRVSRRSFHPAPPPEWREEGRGRRVCTRWRAHNPSLPLMSSLQAAGARGQNKKRQFFFHSSTHLFLSGRHRHKRRRRDTKPTTAAREGWLWRTWKRRGTGAEGRAPPKNPHPSPNHGLSIFNSTSPPFRSPAALAFFFTPSRRGAWRVHAVLSTAPPPCGSRSCSRTSGRRRR